jgi:hypothetical protein
MRDTNWVEASDADKKPIQASVAMALSESRLQSAMRSSRRLSRSLPCPAWYLSQLFRYPLVALAS